MDSKDRALRKIRSYQLHRSSVQAMVVVRNTLNQHGLRRSTYAALSVIVENPSIRQGQLADVLGIDRPNIVKIIDALEDDLLVSRENVQEDRRVYALIPTDKGIKICAQATASLKAVDNPLFETLSEEEIAALQKAIKVIEKNARRITERD